MSLIIFLNTIYESINTVQAKYKIVAYHSNYLLELKQYYKVDECLV